MNMDEQSWHARSLESFRRWLLAFLSNQYTKYTVLALGLLLAVGLLMDWVVMPLYTRHGEEVEMPNITRMQLADARRPLEAEGFTLVNEEERFSDEFPAGYIIEQNPPPLAKVKRGRRVYVVVSRGEKRVLMPSLLERSQRDAELLLARNRLVLAEVNYDYSSIHPEGVIIGQSVPPNAEVAVNTRVTLTVSMGAEPLEFIVPAVEGRTFEDALRRLKHAGLRVGQITYTLMPDLLPETVIHQSIPPGTVVERGAALDLELSTLPGNPAP